jgi:hypothetical protein
MSLGLEKVLNNSYLPTPCFPARPSPTPPHPYRIRAKFDERVCEWGKGRRWGKGGGGGMEEAGTSLVILPRPTFVLPNGTMMWMDDAGLLHRDHDLPAEVRPNGDRFWWTHGVPGREGGKPMGERASGVLCWFDEARRLHRDGDLPAAVTKHGTKYWWVHGVRGRAGDKPTCETADGTLKWLDARGRLHREGDLPAQVFACGDRVWWWHGVPSRAQDRPVCELADGTLQWFDENGRRHRGNDLPAVVFANGDMMWFTHGQCTRGGGGGLLHTLESTDGTVAWMDPKGEVFHREGGMPAVIGPGGRQELWVWGKYHGALWNPRVVKCPSQTACCICLEPMRVGNGGSPPVVVCRDSGHAVCSTCLPHFVRAVGTARACPQCRGPLVDTLFIPPYDDDV